MEQITKQEISIINSNLEKNKNHETFNGEELLKIVQKHSSFLNNNKSFHDKNFDSDQFWCELFFEIQQLEKNIEIKKNTLNEDDCLYFVKKIEAKDKEDFQEKKDFFMRRRNAKNTLPIKYELSIDWEETFFFKYFIT
jgi:hypothetical protein